MDVVASRPVGNVLVLVLVELEQDYYSIHLLLLLALDLAVLIDYLLAVLNLLVVFCNFYMLLLLILHQINYSLS